TRRIRSRPCPRRSGRSGRSRAKRPSRSSATPTRSSADSSTWRRRRTPRSCSRWRAEPTPPDTSRKGPTRTWPSPSRGRCHAAAAIVGAVRGGCDAIFLALHGAMVAEHLDDGEGELLQRVRAVAPRTPIAVGLDFHSHMTARMVDNANVIAGYRTYPHIDMGDT